MFVDMRKLRVQWNPQIEQDVDAVTNSKSPFYDEELTNEIIKQYKTIDNFTKYMKTQIK